MNVEGTYWDDAKFFKQGLPEVPLQPTLVVNCSPFVFESAVYFGGGSLWSDRVS